MRTKPNKKDQCKNFAKILKKQSLNKKTSKGYLVFYYGI